MESSEEGKRERRREVQISVSHETCSIFLLYAVYDTSVEGGVKVFNVLS